jgi:hypothetical protein
MNVDDFAKILIIIAISISLLGISYQTMRLIGSMADSIKDLRKVLQNFGSLSDRFITDYTYITDKVKDIVDTAGGIATNIVEPLGKILSFASKFKRGKKANNEFEHEADDDKEVDVES